MPKYKGLHTDTDVHSRDNPLREITSTVEQPQSGASVSPEKTQTLGYYALLTKARDGTDISTERQPQNLARQKRGRGDRGDAHTLRSRMELVEIFRYLKRTNPKVTASNFHQFIQQPIHRKSIREWEKDFDKIRFDVAYGRGNKRTLSKNPADLIRHIMDKTVYEWLLEVRKNDGIINGLQLEAAADSVLHILTDDICIPNNSPYGRSISFTTSWHSGMTKEYGVAYCNLKGEVGSIDKNAVAERMDEIRNICSKFNPDDIYNCDETGVYLKELFTHSYSTKESINDAKLDRGEARVSILFCVNATGSSLTRAATVEALRPFVIDAHLARDIQPDPKGVPITSMRYGNDYMTQNLFIAWLHSLDDSLINKSLLLVDSCGAHGENRHNSKDPLLEEKWKHLQIERLPPNSTSVTQPLDQGIISAFKRKYLEMLGSEAILKQYATSEKITNGEAWSLIPYAWSHVKASTVRHCFCKARVLSKAQADKLEQDSWEVEEQIPLYPPVADTDTHQVKKRYVRLIASVMDGDRIQFSLDKNQKDIQDLAEETKQRVCNRIAKRYGPRERSSSIEQETIATFKSRHGTDSVCDIVLDMLEAEDTDDRWAARYVIRKSMQQNKP